MSLNVRESIRQYFQNIFDKFFCYSTLTQSKPVEEIDSFFQMRHENMSKVKVMIFYIFASSSNLGEKQTLFTNPDQLGKGIVPQGSTQSSTVY